MTANHSSSSNFCDTLHRRLTRCLQEKSDIRQELANVRTHLEDLVNPIENVLILGDGNLSFSLSYGRIFPGRTIDATVLEPNHSSFVERYGESAKSILQRLASFANVKVFYGVDATKKETIPSKSYDRIIMNFPHHGGKTNIKKARLLLSGIFYVVAKIMKSASNSSTPEFYLTLTREQSEFRNFSSIFTESSATTEQIETGHHMDSWQPIYLAANFELECIRVQPFDPSFFREYKAAGYKRTNRGFKNVLGVTYVFVLRQALSLTNQRNFVNPLLPYYSHHFSFVLQQANRPTDFNKVPRILYQAANGTAIHSIELEELRTHDPDNRENRIYKVTFQSSSSLSKTECNLLVDDTRIRVGKLLKEEQISLILT